MEKYKEYIGKKYIYQGENIEIKKIKNVAGNIVIITYGRTFAFYETEIDIFFKELKPYKMDNKTTLLKESKYSNNEQDEIKQLLFDAINKVKKDKDYVKQANAICNLTSQLINIKKLELLKNK